ncbi:hypothetical protein Ccar_05210 [Clostridium carboxidivorans P7]|uniref:PepSY domain-containing protein n=1 Tax=Clostridium carboxidivorans P7 TaxID=536227 RepID=C6Q172_9CLOT|nr:hypothetical protein [Clostridium carboxidivorans]AKN30254.1 hypothetical protein Ccar_05210 [Clostridium carboxidivorans P7]EET84772.1 conserved hypothetical protein [Clostridium carboxidivorans P7]
MNRKRILVWVLALLVVGGASGITYASQKNDTTKNVVVAAESKSNNSVVRQQGTISDEKAIKIAAEAMKSYMGKDASYFSSTKIHRSSDKRKELEEFRKKYAKEHPEEAKKFEESKKKFAKEHPEDAKIIAENTAKLKNESIIDVDFTPKDFDKNKVCSNFVSINEKTGEVINVTAINGLDENLKSAIDDNKVKDATLSFFKKIGKKISGNTIRADKEIDLGRLFLDCKLEDGRNAGIEINLTDYSVIHYEIKDNDIKTLPSMKKNNDSQTREIKIN